MYVLTTGKAAHILNVSRQTVIRIASNGELTCRKVPGSNHRRIDPATLLKYVKENGLEDAVPQDRIRKVVARVACLGVGDELLSHWRQHAEHHAYGLHVADTLWDLAEVVGV